MPQADRTAGGFWTTAGVAFLFLFAASAPSPLYALYAARWHFSPLTLTAVFAVYALALLLALLLTGSLSDALGRRPVILAAIGLEALSMALFALAPGLGLLFAARVVQGLATGLVTPAVAAALFDFEPAGRPGSAALVNSATPAFGLAAGAVVSGALVEYGPEPLRLVYLVLLGGFALLAAAVIATGGWRARAGVRTLAPKIGVPAGVRRPFAAAVPTLVTTWTLGGFFLSLGPSVVLLLARSHNRLLGGAAILALAGSGGLCTVVLAGWPSRRAMLAGTVALALGLAGAVGAIAIASVPFFFAASVVAGGGFGLAFLGAFRTLSALAPAEGRGALISVVFVISYLAFSLPAVAAGFFTTQAGLRATAIGFGIALTAVAVCGTVTTLVAVPAPPAALRPRPR